MQDHEWVDQQDPSVAKEEGVQRYGVSEVVVPPGRQVNRKFRPVDVHREANKAQEEINEAQEETQP